MDSNRNILLEAMNSIEENDVRANELLTNLCNFYIKLGHIHDEQNVRILFSSLKMSEKIEEVQI